jgi:GT2 family glycosyltransferase
MNPTPSENSPLVSVIILNWNGAAFLPRCLEAVAAQSFRDFEVLVLDNASTDGSLDGLEARWPDFQVVRFSENLGFAVANNRGAHMAHGRWLAFLNNDAFPEADWLAKLVGAAQRRPEFSFFASRLLFAHDPALVQSTGDVLHVSGFAWSRDYRCPLADAHLDEEEVFSPSAAAALYEREAFLGVGGFDERFSSHLEDIDLGFRLRLSGKRCLYVPEAVAMHLVSATYGVESDRTVYQVQRNVVWVYFADMPGSLFWKYLLAHLFTDLVFLAHYTLRGKAGPAWRAKWDALRGLPAALRKRRLLQQDRQVTPAEIERLLDHGWLSPFILGKRGARLRRALKGHSSW